MKKRLFVFARTILIVVFLVSATVAQTGAQPRENIKIKSSEQPRAAAATKIEKNSLGRFVNRSADFSKKTFSLQANELEQEAFEVINEKRRLQNLAALEWDGELFFLARRHSEEMATYNFFSHTGRDGKTVDERAADIGIDDWRAIGENIGFHSGVKNKIEAAVQNWLRSSTHKNNLLSRQWTRTGIGVAVTPEGKFYITQVFRN